MSGLNNRYEKFGVVSLGIVLLDAEDLEVPEQVSLLLMDAAEDFEVPGEFFSY